MRKVDMSTIVSTEGTLGGKPRIKGTRIGVHHVVSLIVHGHYTVSDVAYMIYDHLSKEDVYAALAYYAEHRETIDRITREQRRVPEDAISGPEDLPVEPAPSE
ncbi:DUF433 domain-containing protein [Halobacteriales archaeon QS_3_64_16]|nr:MAG: DUF433 domain-containing protein [Halobacteriales archaeon QS_3_64_16]